MAAQLRRLGLKPVARQLHQPPRRHQRADPLRHRLRPRGCPRARCKREPEVRARRIGRTSARPLQLRDPGSPPQPPATHPAPRARTPYGTRRERLPQPPVAVRPRTGDQPRERRHAGQQHTALAQPADRIREDRTRTITGHVRPRRDPLLELVTDRGEIPQPLRGLDLLRMLKPRPPSVQVARHARRILDLDLARHIRQHHQRHISRIRQERAQPPNRRQLQREPKLIRRAAALADQLPVRVIQKEDPVQLHPRRRAIEASIRRRLRVRQELDRHPRTIATITGAQPRLAALFVPLFLTGRDRLWDGGCSSR